MSFNRRAEEIQRMSTRFPIERYLVLATRTLTLTNSDIEELEGHGIIQEDGSVYRLCANKSVLDLARYVTRQLPRVPPSARNSILKTIFGESLANIRVLYA